MYQPKQMAENLKEAYEEFAIFCNRKNKVAKYSTNNNAIFFDKDNHVYLLKSHFVPADAFTEFATHYFEVYNFDKRNLGNYDKLERVANASVRIYPKYAYLEQIEILDEQYLNKKIGSNLINYCKYVAYQNHFDSLYAYVLSLNTIFIKNEDLLKFYHAMGAEMSGRNARMPFAKKQAQQYEKNQIRIKQGALTFDVIVPDNLKNELYPLIHPKKSLENNQEIDLTQRMCL